MSSARNKNLYQKIIFDAEYDKHPLNTGTQERPLTEAEIQTVAGEWMVRDADGFLGRFTIAPNGEISMQSRGDWVAHLSRTNNEIDFPESDGMLDFISMSDDLFY